MGKADAKKQAAPNTGGNPYLNGREEWLERYGGYITRAAQWRMAAFAGLALTAGAVAACIVMASQYKVVPYLVAVDKLGRAVAVERADVAAPAPKRLVQAELAGVVVNWRTVTADKDLQNRMIEQLSSFLTGAAKGQMRHWFEEHNPFDRARRGQLVQVEVTSLPLAVSKHSWWVEWTETVRNHAGAVIEPPQKYAATLTIEIKPPETDAQVVQNPGGVYVTDLSFSKLLDEKLDR
ncbi:MAG: VirB8/TrbF family protein [Desulfovibrionaceae bacterium]